MYVVFKEIAIITPYDDDDDDDDDLSVFASSMIVLILLRTLDGFSKQIDSLEVEQAHLMAQVRNMMVIMMIMIIIILV